MASIDSNDYEKKFKKMVKEINDTFSFIGDDQKAINFIYNEEDYENIEITILNGELNDLLINNTVSESTYEIFSITSFEFSGINKTNSSFLGLQSDYSANLIFYTDKKKYVINFNWYYNEDGYKILNDEIKVFNIKERI